MNLFSQIPCPLLICDKQGFIKTVNRSYSNLFPEKNTFKETNLESYVSQKTIAYLQDYVWPLLLEKGEVSDLSLELEISTDKALPVLVRASSIIYEGDEHFCWVFVGTKKPNDYSQELVLTHKQLEHQNTKLQEITESLNLKNDELKKFVYTVTHDLKAPLISIAYYIKSLISELDVHMNDKQRYKFDRVDKNVKHLGFMLNDLLSLSRVLGQDIQKERVDTKEVLDQVWNSLERTVSECGAEIVFTDDVIPLTANKLLLSQCLTHLLTNAIRYRSDKRSLVIKISLSQTPKYTELHVSDNGIGIAKKYQDKVFDVFEQGSSEQGTGIGLSIVKAVMEKHSGTVSLESKHDAGCCFILRFPKSSIEV